MESLNGGNLLKLLGILKILHLGGRKILFAWNVRDVRIHIPWLENVVFS
jgi:hypothetical protein